MKEENKKIALYRDSRSMMASQLLNARPLLNPSALSFSLSHCDSNSELFGARHALYALEYSEPYGIIPLEGSESAFLSSPDMPMSHLSGSVIKREEMQEMPEMSNDTEMMADYRVRRREQNRAAQRAFRERRAKYVKDLEHQLMELQDRYSRKEDEVTKLIIRIKELTMEISLLRNTNPGFFHNGMGHQTSSIPCNIYNTEIIDSEGEISGK